MDLELDGEPKTLLLTLTGTDRPGVTAGVFARLAEFDVDVLDMEQIVLRGRLILGVLVSAPRPWKALREAIEKAALDLDMAVEVDKGHGDNQARRRGRSHVTVLGHAADLPRSRPRSPGGSPTSAPTSTGSSGWRATPSPRSTCTCPGPTPTGCGWCWPRRRRAQQVDVAVQPANLLRHGMRLIVMDVDSTLVQGEVIEMLAEKAGCLEEVVEVTSRGDARRPRLRGVAAPAGRAAGGARRERAGRGLRRADPHAGRTNTRTHAQATGLPVRHRLRRFHAGDRPARR